MRPCQVTILEKDILSERANVKLEIAFPAKRVIERVIKSDVQLMLLQEEIEMLAKRGASNKTVVYPKVGRLMLAVLDSLSQQRYGTLFQYYETKKVIVLLEFEFLDWKIKDISS